MIYVYSALFILGLFCIAFLICTYQNNYGLVDIAWGLVMASLSIFLIILYKPDLQITLSLSLIVLWGLRLGVYLTRRNWGKPEDYRYIRLRERWGVRYPLVKAFFNVFMLQSVFSFLMMFGSMNAISRESVMNKHALFVGIIIAVFGLCFEILGDMQLAKFKSNPINKGKLMKQGVWKMTRHPNYFGEVVFWWGTYIASFQNLYSLLGMISPILITVLINFVSGIPLLEKKYSSNSDYIAYAKITPRMIPIIGSRDLRK